MKVLGLVPARGGSKGIPSKNVRDLAGKPLIRWAIDSALEAGVLDRVVVSTDDDLIAKTASLPGVDLPFKRPPELSVDEAPMIDVVIHALDELQQDGYRPDAVAILQPTSPLRRAEHIRAACEMLEDADSVCSVVAVPRELCPHYVMSIDRDGLLRNFLPEGTQYVRRQDVPLAYSRDGTIYLVRTEVVLGSRTLYGDRCLPMLVDPADSLSIDDPADWEEAERRLAERRAN